MTREHDYFVCLLSNAARTVLYIGATNDLATRLKAHRANEKSGFTK